MALSGAMETPLPRSSDRQGADEWGVPLSQLRQNDRGSHSRGMAALDALVAPPPAPTRPPVSVAERELATVAGQTGEGSQQLRPLDEGGGVNQKLADALAKGDFAGCREALLEELGADGSDPVRSLVPFLAGVMGVIAADSAANPGARSRRRGAFSQAMGASGPKPSEVNPETLFKATRRLAFSKDAGLILQRLLLDECPPDPLDEERAALDEARGCPDRVLLRFGFPPGEEGDAAMRSAVHQMLHGPDDADSAIAACS